MNYPRVNGWINVEDHFNSALIVGNNVVKQAGNNIVKQIVIVKRVVLQNVFWIKIIKRKDAKITLD